MVIYTKTGDTGDTGLLGGKRVKKDCIEMRSIGEVDELNAEIGVLLSCIHEKDESMYDHLVQIQHRLFTIGALLASVQTDLVRVPSLMDDDVKALEEWIDEMTSTLPELTQFILPGGTNAGAQSFLARAVCRRAEREIVGLMDVYKIDPLVLQYLNRLSDALFVFGRYLNMKEGVGEVVWQK